MYSYTSVGVSTLVYQQQLQRRGNLLFCDWVVKSYILQSLSVHKCKKAVKMTEREE